MPAPRIAILIDKMLGADKTIGGVPDWKSVNHGEHRLVMPLQIDGESSGALLEINAYPNIRELRYRVMILSPICVFRIDYVDDEPHVNPLGLGPYIPKGQFCEPHYHSWGDNRHLCTGNALPVRLLVARIFPRIRQFDAGLRWFCGKTKIAQPSAGLIQLPRRSALL
jgi:hypothetical protein